MVGGIVTSLILELTVYPAIFAIWRGRSLDRRRDDLEAAP
jgi:Cu/Ag efflux pump CusA